MSIKSLIPKSFKGVGKRLFRRMGYDLVYHQESPATFHRYPYANQTEFFQDIGARGFNPKLAVDVGANHGSWSADLATVFPSVKSVLVEPQQELKSHLSSIGEGKNDWVIAPVGLGAANEIRQFVACDDTVSSSFLKDGEDAEGDIRELEVITLPKLIEDYANGEQPQLIKIDAEGLELEIINAGRDVIKAADIVMLEVSFFTFNEGQPRFAELVSTMDELGFSIYDFTMFYRRPYGFALGLMDCVFVSDNSHLRQSHAWK